MQSVELSPLPGFCIKTSTLQPGTQTKLFVNIAYSTNVPPPPQADEPSIQRAIQGSNGDSDDGAWYLPVIVSDPRSDTDKAGSPALVIDCIYNSNIKARVLTDPEFRLFVIELALQRIEAQNHLTLSRQIRTPNIASKGKLAPRRVRIPTALLSGPHVSLDQDNITAMPGKPLIQELTLDRPKGILKKAPGAGPVVKSLERSHKRIPWSWSKTDEDRLKIEVAAPGLTHALIKNTTLDIEPRRFILNIPGRPILDVDVGKSDAEIVAGIFSGASKKQDGSKTGNKSADEISEGEEREKEKDAALLLKRQRDLDVEGAEAEWRVADEMVVMYV